MTSQITHSGQTNHEFEQSVGSSSIHFLDGGIGANHAQTAARHPVIASSSLGVAAFLSVLHCSLSMCIDQKHVLSVVAAKVRDFWSSKPGFGPMLVKLIEFLVAAQYVELESDIWSVQSGLPTGLQASAVFANLYLAAFDDFFVQKFSRAKLWKRYIDDAFAILPLECQHECLLELNTSVGHVRLRCSGAFPRPHYDSV